MRKIALRLTRMRPIGRGYAMRGAGYARLRRAGGTERGRERGRAESRERRHAPSRWLRHRPRAHHRLLLGYSECEGMLDVSSRHQPRRSLIKAVLRGGLLFIISLCSLREKRGERKNPSTSRERSEHLSRTLPSYVYLNLVQVVSARVCSALPKN